MAVGILKRVLHIKSPKKKKKAFVLSAAPKEVQPTKDNDGAFLYLHYQSHTHLLHRHFHRLYSGIQSSLQFATSSGPLHLQNPEAGS